MLVIIMFTFDFSLHVKSNSHPVCSLYVSDQSILFFQPTLKFMFDLTLVRVTNIQRSVKEEKSCIRFVKFWVSLSLARTIKFICFVYSRNQFITSHLASLSSSSCSTFGTKLLNVDSGFSILKIHDVVWMVSMNIVWILCEVIFCDIFLHCYFFAKTCHEFLI